MRSLQILMHTFAPALKMIHRGHLMNIQLLSIIRFED